MENKDFISCYKQAVKIAGDVANYGYTVIAAADFINGELKDYSLLTHRQLAIVHWYTKVYGEDRKTTYDELSKLLKEHRLIR